MHIYTWIHTYIHIHIHVLTYLYIKRESAGEQLPCRTAAYGVTLSEGIYTYVCTYIYRHLFVYIYICIYSYRHIFVYIYISFIFSNMYRVLAGYV
jgi:hypothetical protein